LTDRFHLKDSDTNCLLYSGTVSIFFSFCAVKIAQLKTKLNASTKLFGELGKVFGVNNPSGP